MPKVSVLLPTFNRPKWLVEAVDSVLSQDCDLELLILDNGSGEETGATLQRYANDPRVRLFRSDTNIKGYQFLAPHATGDYAVLFTDDDRMLPGSLKAKIAQLDDDQSIGMVFSPVFGIDAYGNRRDSGLGYAKSGRVVFDDLMPCCIVVMPSCVFMASFLPILEDMEPFGLLGDWGFWLEVLSRCDGFCLKDETIELRIHEGSDTNSNGFKQGKFLEFAPKVWRHWFDRGVKADQNMINRIQTYFLMLLAQRFESEAEIMDEWAKFQAFLGEYDAALDS